MKTYKVTNIITIFDLFIDEEVEANNIIDAREEILNEIIDNIGTYINIEMEEVE